jgi:hypothetical protein
VKGAKGGILEHLSGFWNKAEASGASQGLVLVCASLCFRSLFDRRVKVV